MGKLFILLTYLGSLGDPKYHGAADTSRRALMEYPFVKEEVQQLGDESEKWIKRNIGLNKEDLVYAAYLYPLATGSISTKPFKNLKVVKFGLTVRPEIEYSFYSHNYSGMLILNKEF